MWLELKFIRRLVVVGATSNICSSRFVIIHKYAPLVFVQIASVHTIISIIRYLKSYPQGFPQAVDKYKLSTELSTGYILGGAVAYDSHHTPTHHLTTFPQPFHLFHTTLLQVIQNPVTRQPITNISQLPYRLLNTPYPLSLSFPFLTPVFIFHIIKYYLSFYRLLNNLLSCLYYPVTTSRLTSYSTPIHKLSKNR